MEEAKCKIRDLLRSHQDEYEYIMRIADELEREEQEYFKFMEELQEQSINFEMRERQKQIEKLKREIEEKLDEQ